MTFLDIELICMLITCRGRYIVLTLSAGSDSRTVTGSLNRKFLFTQISGRPKNMCRRLQFKIRRWTTNPDIIQFFGVDWQRIHIIGCYKFSVSRSQNSWWARISDMFIRCGGIRMCVFQMSFIIGVGDHIWKTKPNKSISRKNWKKLLISRKKCIFVKFISSFSFFVKSITIYQLKYYNGKPQKNMFRTCIGKPFTNSSA